MTCRLKMRGFTLIELIIVVAIIGILAAVAVPVLASYRKKAFSTAALSDIKNAKNALENYFIEHACYPNQ